MNKYLITILVFCFSESCILAQDTLCTQCICLWEKAEKAQAMKDYQTAIMRYNAVSLCDETYKPRANKRILNIYQEIERQKQAESLAKRIAQQQRDRADAATIRANTEKEKAEKTARSSHNTALALITLEQDPTLALRIAEYNYQQHSDNPAAATALKQIRQKAEGQIYSAVLNGHKGEVTCVSFLPNGKRVISGSTDSTIRVWDFLGNLLQTIRVVGEVRDIAVSMKGKIAYTIKKDTSVYIWEYLNNVNKSFTTKGLNVKCLSFSSDDQFLLGGTTSGNVLYWDERGNVIQNFKCSENGVINSVQFSPNNQTFATGSSTTEVAIWDLEGRHINKFEGHHEPITSVFFEESGQILITGSQENDAIIWDTKTAKPIRVLKGHKGDILTVSMLQKQGIIATGSQDCSIKLWTGNGLGERTLLGHSRSIKKVAIKEDGGWLASAGKDSCIRLWCITDGSFINRQNKNGEAIKVGFTSDTILWSVHKSGTILFFDKNLNCTKGIKDSTDEEVLTVANLNTLFLLGKSDGSISLWNKETGLKWMSKIDSNEIIGTAITKDECTFYSAASNGLVYLLDSFGKSKRKIQLEPFEGFLLFPQENKFLVWRQGQQGTLSIYSTSGVLLKTFSSGSYPISCCIISEDNAQIIVGYMNGTIIIFDLEGNVKSKTIAHTKPVRDLYFDSIYKQILSGSEDFNCKIWNRFGYAVWENEFLEWITAVALSKDGKTILVGRQKGMIGYMQNGLLENRAAHFSNADLKNFGVQLEK